MQPRSLLETNIPMSAQDFSYPFAFQYYHHSILKNLDDKGHAHATPQPRREFKYFDI